MSDDTTAPVETEQPPQPSLRLLGRVAVLVSDGWADAQVGRAASVLALLAMEAGRVVSFDRLVEQLWGDAPPTAVRSTVYANVSRLRSLLRGSDFGIEARPPGYVLTGPRDAVDAHLLARLVGLAEESELRRDRSAVLAAADRVAALWQAPFGGADLREDLAHEAKRLEHLAERAEELAATALLELGRADEAARRAGDLVRRDVYNEAYWRLRMRAEHAAGRTAAALETYAELRGFLGDELGIDPGEQTRALHLEVLREADAGDEGPPVVRGPSRSPETTGAVPDLQVPAGRGREVALLDAAVERCLGGAGRVVLLEGEPGIGKTRLAEHAADRTARAGAHVVWARAIEGPGTPPPWVWENVLRDLRDRRGTGGSVGPVDLEPQPAGPGVTPAQARFRVFERVAAEVVAAADPSPLVLVLDDLHWADEGTLQVLDLLAARLRGHRCLVLATSRPRPGAGSDPLAASVRSGHVDRISLGPLDAAGVAELVASWEGPLEAAVRGPDGASTLRDRAGGNPFLLTELLRDGGTGRVPASVGELVARRLAELSDEARSVLLHAALAGRRVDPALLARALRSSVADVVGLLDPSGTDGLVVSDPRTRTLTFAHDLVREAVAERVPVAEALGVHARLAEAVAALHAADPAGHLDELADHRYLASGGVPSLPAYEACMAAADHAAAVHAYDQAAVHRQRALEMLAPGEDHRDMRFEVLLELSTERRLAGDVLGAGQGLSQALAVARGMGDAVLLRRALALLGEVTMWNWRHFGEVDREAVAALEEAVALDDVASRSRAMPAAERARVLGTLAVELYYGDDPDRSRELARDSVALARTTGDPELLGRTLNNYVIAAWSPEQDAARLAALDESLSLAGRGLPRVTETIARLHRGPLRLQEADVAGFLDDLTQAERLAGRLGRTELEAQVASQWMGYHLLRGDLGAARESLETTYRILVATSLWGGEWIRHMGRLAMARVEGTVDGVVGPLVDRARGEDHLYRWTALLALALAGEHHDARVLQARWGLSSVPRRAFWGSHFEWAQAAEVSLLLGTPEPTAAVRLVARLSAPVVLVGTALVAWGPVDLLRARLAAAAGDAATEDRHRVAVAALDDRLEAALGTRPVWPLAQGVASRVSPVR